MLTTLAQPRHEEQQSTRTNTRSVDTEGVMRRHNMDHRTTIRIAITAQHDAAFGTGLPLHIDTNRPGVVA